ncbi:DUF4145 domain-containing protein [Streptomyces hydrogenans]|uniref:DUF4145 domain-containing protein n=1 Tax=Streptomyces hydrogenans TaxID=1873719 RepID=UPI0038074539
MEMVGQAFELPREGQVRRYVAAFRCPNEECRQLSIGEGTQPSDATSFSASRDLIWTPVEVDRPPFPDVPEQIAAVATEAHACLSFQAHRAAVALARAVVEATAKTKGVTSGTLMQKIDELHKKGHIRDFTKAAAHAVREGGNEIAHGDLIADEMPPEDAKSIVNLMDGILREVFQDPAQMQALAKSSEGRRRRSNP